jgi:hypothetical protein
MAPSVHERRLLALREERAEVGGRAFTLRRLGDLAVAQLRERCRRDGADFVVELVRQTVVGWEMDEAGLYPGGGDSAVEFSTELFMTWVEDQPETFSGLAERALAQLTARHAAREASAKN